MQKNKKIIKRKNNKKTHLLFFLSTILLFVLLFILYSLWIPSSQIFWKTTYKNSDSFVSLTFDDGPGPDTENILSILKENNVTATFFITCEHINESEISLIKKMSDDGNIVALHGYNHKIFQEYDKLNSCKQILENITGKEVSYFRPPYGFKSPSTMNAAKKLNLTVVTWSVFPRDYNAKDSKTIINRVENNLKKNSIICFHDGPANRKNTADALPEILRFIDEKKYKLDNLN